MPTEKTLSGQHAVRTHDGIRGVHDSTRDTRNPPRWGKTAGALIAILAVLTIVAGTVANVSPGDLSTVLSGHDRATTPAPDSSLEQADFQAQALPTGSAVGEAMRTEVYAVDPLQATSGWILLDVPWVEQLPALPSGCEITAATAMLDYYGFDASNVELNEYLAQGWTNWNPREAFIGYCESEGWMVYPEPVVEALNGYLASQGRSGEYGAVNITGTSAEDLYTYLQQGTPVTVWVTTYLQERSIADSWYVDDELFTASEQDHAMTLAGYSDDEVALVDPFEGLTYYPRDTFESIYDERGRMACIIVVNSQ